MRDRIEFSLEDSFGALSPAAPAARKSDHAVAAGRNWRCGTKDFERAHFESNACDGVRVFYDRKTALQSAMEMSPADFNFRVAPAFLKAEGNFDLRPKLKSVDTCRGLNSQSKPGRS